MSLFTSDYLIRVRNNALRKRVWHRALDRLERGIINLTIKYVENLKSPKLAGHIVKILAKLRDACKSAFTRHIESYGYRRLRLVVKQAKDFGCVNASSWLWDEEYAEWFALNDYHNPVGWSE